MKLKTGVLAGLAVGLVAAVVWKVGPDLRAGRQKMTPPPASAAPAPAAPKVNADGIALERDQTAVFQRAFWRRPAAGDRILHAERRDWHTAGTGVEKWQWFIAVQPSAAFRDWLLKENPFELVPVAADAAFTPLSSPPDWFPSPTELTALARYRNREGRYQVFHDAKTNRLYATDSGGGFAGPAR